MTYELKTWARGDGIENNEIETNNHSNTFVYTKISGFFYEQNVYKKKKKFAEKINVFKKNLYPVHDMQYKYYYPMQRTIKELIRVNVFFFFTRRTGVYLYGSSVTRCGKRKLLFTTWTREGSNEKMLATRSRYRVRLLSVLTVPVHIVVRSLWRRYVRNNNITIIIIIIVIGKLRSGGEEVVKNFQ